MEHKEGEEMIDPPEQEGFDIWKSICMFLLGASVIVFILFDPQPKILFMECAKARIGKRAAGSREMKRVEAMICIWGD